MQAQGFGSAASTNNTQKIRVFKKPCMVNVKQKKGIARNNNNVLFLFLFCNFRFSFCFYFGKQEKNRKKNKTKKSNHHLTSNSSINHPNSSIYHPNNHTCNNSTNHRKCLKLFCFIFIFIFILYS